MQASTEGGRARFWALLAVLVLVFAAVVGGAGGAPP
jgi:hypothetical protein